MNVLQNLHLKWKLILGFTLPIILVIAMSMVIYKSVNDLIDTAGWVNHTHEAIKLADNLGAAMVDMETGLRGYLVSGQEGFLEPYVGGQEQFSTAMATATKHVSDNPTQVGRLEQIQALRDEWQQNHAEVAIDMRKRSG